MSIKTDASANSLRDNDGFISLQTLIHTEQGISTERELYLRLEGAAGFSESTGEVVLGSGGRVSFDTWFNFFNIGKWRRWCDIDDLHLKLRGQGKLEVRVVIAYPAHSWDIAKNEILELQPSSPVRLDLSDISPANDKAIIWFELRALEDNCRLEAAEWQTRREPIRIPDLMLSITTFRREEAVQATVKRFEDYLPKSALRDHLHVCVVDNGRSAGVQSSSWVTAIDNENLGGSGGFARGLLEARHRHASHCLFMDDDAATHMGSIERTWMLLAYATDPKTAVSGAMTNAAHRWSLWEYGAVFDHSCRPQGIGTDLRNLPQILTLEFSTTGKQPDNFYGGWWYFAFPIDQVKYDPFPFFVRGDDISFSLANGFSIARLNGVVCFQDADFSDKESLQTLYLDLRSHMVHHLTQPSLKLSRSRALVTPAWFFFRSLAQLHYETLASLNLAFQDVMQGPQFFESNADMSNRRAVIAGLRKDETLRDEPKQFHPSKRRFNPDKRWKRKLMIATLNGHLIPFFRYFGDHVEIKTNERGQLHRVWGASVVRTTDVNTQKSFTLVHSKRKAARQIGIFLKNAMHFWLNYDKISKDWRSGYPRLASESYWNKRLGITENKKIDS